MATEHEGSPVVGAADNGSTFPQRSGSNAEAHLERLAQTFETSARREELIVYPSVVGFVLSSLYGFYLMRDIVIREQVLQGTVDAQQR